MFFAYLVAVAERLIAVALITGFARKLTYLSAIIFSLPIWATAEGFGGPYTSGASDIVTAIIYAVVYAGLLALSYYAAPARYSADYYLEKKYPWWWMLAELRRPAPQADGSSNGRTRRNGRRAAARRLAGSTPAPGAGQQPSQGRP